MMRLKQIILGLVIIALGAGAYYAYGSFRRVDGRTAAQWVAFARQANYSTPYHAEGRTLVQDREARFTLDQGRNGRYAMRITDDTGHYCRLGSDGKSIWYQTAKNSASVEADAAPNTHFRLCCRLLGTGTMAGRPVVRVAMRQGHLTKIMAIDRERGVILAMATTFLGKSVSRMTVETVAYREVAIDTEKAEMRNKLRKTTQDEMKRLLGSAPLRPGWLPAGFAPQGSYLGHCNCCAGEMAALRYSDGLRALTLFQMPGEMHCAMDKSCTMAPSKSALVETRITRGITVTAVADLDTKTLKRVLDGLK